MGKTFAILARYQGPYPGLLYDISKEHIHSTSALGAARKPAEQAHGQRLRFYST